MFVKPIDRELKGVIKIGREDTMAQELEEYVVTRELQKHFAEFFAHYKKGASSNMEEMGVWISGFFGSGKSHFLKILSYLLSDTLVDGKKPIDYFLDDDKISDEMVLADMRVASQLSTDVILFNIDSKSDSANKQLEKETILSVFLKAFNQHLGYYGANPHLADLERNLDNENLFDTFKNTFAEISNKNWEDARSNFRFVRGKVSETLVKIGYMEKEAAEHTCDSLTDDYTMSIEAFAKLISNYCESKGKNHHVLFMVDEMGQYISENTGLMLNLQTVTEDLGTHCQGKAWVMVTSQEDIDSITQTKGNDFSKIQGRFYTRLSLSSANVDEVIRKRVLAKTDNARLLLKTLYDENETILKNLLVFNDGVEKKLYSNNENFADVYPFIPYQFHLLQSVLTAVREHGASGKHLAEGERSMLALFKDSATKRMSQSEGILMPFHLFYDEIARFLDSEYRKVILQAADNTRLEEFDVSVLKTLFLIKYVKEIKSNLVNISTLMVENISDDRILLEKKVESSLLRLVGQTLVLNHGEIYTFLSNEEQEINREINQITIENSILVNKISSLMFDDLYTNRHFSTTSNPQPLEFNQKLDESFYKNNQQGEFTLEVLTPNFDGIVDESSLKIRTTTSNSVVVAIPEDNKFVEELRVSLKIERYLADHSTDTDGRKEIKDQKREEKTQREKNAKDYLTFGLQDARIYACSEKIQITNKDFKVRINAGLEKLVKTMYHKQNIMNEPMNEANIRGVLKETVNSQMVISGAEAIPNQQALDSLDSYLTRRGGNNQNITLKQVLDQFSKAPYGFTYSNIQWLVAKLFKQGNLSLKKNNEEITQLSKTNDEIFELLTLKKNFESVLLFKREKASESDKQKAADICDELFDSVPENKNDDVVMSKFITGATRILGEMKSIEDRFYSQSQFYPCKMIVAKGKKKLEQVVSMKSSGEFYKYVRENFDDFMDLGEDYKDIYNFFHGTQLEIWQLNNSLLEIYDDSKNYISDTDIHDIAESLIKIKNLEKPFGKIKDMVQLREDYNNKYSELLDFELNKVLPEIEDGKKRVLEELEDKLCKEKLLQNVLDQFNALVEKAEKSNNVTKVKNVDSEVGALKTRLLDLISKTEQKLVDEKRPIPKEIKEAMEEFDTEKPETTLGLANDEAYSTTYREPEQKPQKYMTIRNLSSNRTWKIESVEDVKQYVETLEKRLIEELQREANTVLNVEF